MARSTDVWSRHYLNWTEDHIFASLSKIKTNLHRSDAATMIKDAGGK